jgi:hypothetical protein
MTARANLKHGTLAAYCAYGCRCPMCCAANSNYRSRQRAGLPRVKETGIEIDQPYIDLTPEQIDACFDAALRYVRATRTAEFHS